MRLTTPAGLVVRALLSATITLGVLLATIAFLIGLLGAVLSNFGSIASTYRTEWWTVFALGAAGTVLIFARVIRKTIRDERRRLLADTAPSQETTVDDAAAIEATVRRLATQFDVPEPAVRFHTTSIPIAYTTYRPQAPIVRTGDDSTPTIVLSEGIVTMLSRSEIEAVLAHELAHVVNDDLRLTSWILVPLVAAETLRQDEGYPANVIDLVGHVLVFVASIGVGVFSRGRELAADRGAVAVTGKPETLATVLQRLDESCPDTPRTDLREHARSTNAIAILPTLGDEEGPFGLRSTHPPLDVRIEQLETVARS